MGIFRALNNVYSGRYAFIKHLILFAMVAVNMSVVNNDELWTYIYTILYLILLGSYSVYYMHKIIHNDNKDFSLPDLKDFRWQTLYEFLLVSILWGIYYLISGAILFVLLCIPILIFIAGLGRGGSFLMTIILFTIYIPIFNIIKVALMRYADNYKITDILNPLFLLKMQKDGLKSYLNTIFKFVGISYIALVIWCCAMIPVVIVLNDYIDLTILDLKTLISYFYIMLIPLEYFYIILWDFVLPASLKVFYINKFRTTEISDNLN